jgi:hypothetical protein
MKTKLLATAFAALMVMGAASSAVAKGNPNPPPPAPALVVLPAVASPCGAGDLNLGSAVYGDCRGFYAGQYLGGNASPDLAVQVLALGELGLVFDPSTFGTLPNASGLGGQTVLTFASLTSTNPFPTKLFGTTFIGVHYGKGMGSPVNANGGSTAFYRFDAGDAGISSLTLNYAASSDFILYKTGADPCVANPALCDGGGGGNGVPEPASWALMIMGFGGVGAMIRRRRTAIA